MEPQPSTSSAPSPPPRSYLKHRCEHCGKRFKQLYNLRQHERQRHGPLETPSPPPTPAPRQPSTQSETPTDEQPSLFRIYQTEPRVRPRFGLAEVVYRAELTEEGLAAGNAWTEGIGSMADVVLRIISAILGRVGEGLNDRSLIQLSIIATGPHGLDYPLFIPPTRKKDLSPEFILSHLERILQSNEQFRLDGNLLFEVVTARLPLGGKRNKPQAIVEEKWLKNSSSILLVENRDENCFSRAMVLALAHLLQSMVVASGSQVKPAPPKWVQDDALCSTLWGRYSCKDLVRRGSRQEKVAETLRRLAGLPSGRSGVAEMEMVQNNYLTRIGIRLTVFSKRRHGVVIFTGPQDLPRHIYLYHYNDHYAALTSPQALLNRSYYCHFCQKGFDNRERHKCEMTCHRCKKHNGAP